MSTNGIILDGPHGAPSGFSRSLWARAATAGLAAGLAFLLIGDRGAHSAVPSGIDPLEVLNLQVRANAIIVLDSSGSMGETVGGTQLSGDDRNSKMVLAKQVIQDVVTANQTKVSFQFGRYDQPGLTLEPGTAAGTATPTNPERFAYSSTSTEQPSMLTTELVVDLRSYLVPAGAKMIFRENASVTNRVGNVTAGRYATGTELAVAMTTAMNSALPAGVNQYSVTYTPTHRFLITRTSGSGTFNMRGAAMGTTATSFGTEVGFTVDGSPSSSTTAPCSVANPCLTSAATQGDIDLVRTTANGFTEGGVEYYRMFSRPYFNGKRVNVLANGIACSTSNQTAGDNTAANPPYVELQLVTSCSPLTTSGSPVKFIFSGAGDTGPGSSWNTWSGTNTCGGFQSLVPLSPCTTNLQLDSILNPHLGKEIKINADGTLAGYAETANGDVSSNPTSNGIKAAGFTPIAQALIDLKTLFSTLWSTSISGFATKPRTFVIFVTDGDDTCSDDTTSAFPPDDNHALRAARKAELLHNGITSDPASSVTTFFIVFGTSAQTDRANWIAWGGSGMKADGNDGLGVTNSPLNDMWNSIPTATKLSKCSTCQNAFIASNASDLAAAIQTAIDQGQNAGEFSDQQSITESIYEMTTTVPVPSPSPTAGPTPSPGPAPNPLRADNRYSTTVPVLLQSTFEMPGFKGHLNSFLNTKDASNNDVTQPAWGPQCAGSPPFPASCLDQSDAGKKLFDRVVTNSLTAGQYTFQVLRGGTTATDTNIGTITALGTIRRRIYSTTQNGVYTSGMTDTARVNALIDNSGGPVNFRAVLWPPSAAVDPVGAIGSYPAGNLDNALGIGAAPLPPPNSTTAPAALTFAQLKTQFGACTAQAGSAAGSRLHPDCCTVNTGVNGCTAIASGAVQLARARKEARQIILAYTAGATLDVNNGFAVRTGSGTCSPTGTQACGELRFAARSWILAESTLAAPAVVAPPLESAPSAHNAEYQLFRDGPRNASNVAQDAIALGFGLRNPDKDALTPPDPTGTTRMSLKPVMSVVYHATNAMLHAFRAGPCLNSSGGFTCTDGSTERGGEELWGFVPFDQLSNLKERMKPQARDPHTYMMAAPIRFADIFVPGDISPVRTVGGATISGTGVWRTVLLFGRGIGGRYLTALDVTAPGPFTKASLLTAPPIPLWSRGNPDTVDGTTGGTANNTIGSNTDGTQYAGLGQTWSVPAIGFATALSNTTARNSNGTEWVAYTGSGYGSGPSAASQGTTFYALDMITGDVIDSFDVGDRTGVGFENALVAGPSVFNPYQLKSGFVGNAAANVATLVYFPDIHGRIWRAATTAPGSVQLFADAGANQPLANSLALLNYAGSGTTDKPHVFAESGNDNRVTPPPAATPPFKLFGFRDDNLPVGPSGSATTLFAIDLPDQFRGTVQPATAFAPAVGTNPPAARVFFAANRFNPPGSANAPQPTPPCISSFDAILFALGAESGNAAYDLSASGDDRFAVKTGQRVQAIRASGGRLVVDTGLQADIAPPPPQPPVALPPQPAPLANVFLGAQPGTPLFTQSPASFKVGSSVCR
jgi:hypothetical protein